MSIADFVLAFVGIIVGLGVADLLTSLHKLLRAGKRVTWHWATPSLAALMLLVTLVIWWWSFSWYSDLKSESIATFLPRFLVLVLSFLMMAAALPDDVPESGIDLKKYYLGSRVHLWSLMSATFGGFLFFYWLDHWSLGVARILVVTWLPMTSVALAITATISARMWVHALAIGWISAGMLYNNLFWSIGR
jgi:hypothetical protein